MTVLLKAFGTLKSTEEVQDLREKLYLIHQPPISFSMEVDRPIPTESLTKKAVVEGRGKYENEMLVNKFIGLE